MFLLPLNSYVQALAPAPKCDGINRWGLWDVIRQGHEGGAPMMGLVPL